MKYLFLIICILFSLISLSQEEDIENGLNLIKRNSLYLEMGGVAGFYSVNYDRILEQKKSGLTSFSVGATYWGKIDYSDGRTNFGIPVSYNYLIGKNNHHLELGIGITFLYYKFLFQNLYSKEEEKGIASSFLLKCGYRYQKPTGGMFYKVTFTPLLDAVRYYKKVINISITNTSFIEKGFGNNGFFPWAGISVGYTFKK